VRDGVVDDMTDSVLRSQETCHTGLRTISVACVFPPSTDKRDSLWQRGLHHYECDLGVDVHLR